MRLINALCIQMLFITDAMNTKPSVMGKKADYVVPNARPGLTNFGRYLLLKGKGARFSSSKIAEMEIYCVVEMPGAGCGPALPQQDS